MLPPLKKVLSDNVFFKTQDQNFSISCISWKNHAPFMRYSVFGILNHLCNFESCDVMMNDES